MKVLTIAVLLLIVAVVLLVVYKKKEYFVGMKKDENKPKTMDTKKVAPSKYVPKN